MILQLKTDPSYLSCYHVTVPSDIWVVSNGLALFVRSEVEVILASCSRCSVVVVPGGGGGGGSVSMLHLSEFT